MSERPLVIDACALIAYIKGEPGKEAIKRILSTPPDGGLFMHSVNVCEVAYHMIKFGFIESIACEIATPDGITVIDNFGPKLWKRTAGLKAKYKYLSLGDCMAISLAETLDADIITGDREFLTVETTIGIQIFR